LVAPPNEHRYLSTVIQVSLLGFVHNKYELAEVLSDILVQRSDPTNPTIHETPGYDALLGVIGACAEQTSNFKWSLMFDAVRLALGIQYENAFRTLYPGESKKPERIRHKSRTLTRPVLRGLITALSAAQSLPDDRTVVIETLKGTPTIVLWAHHILGLTVLVKIQNGKSAEDVRFGTGTPQVVIDSTNICMDQDGEICLLNGDQDKVFYLAIEDSMGSPLEAVARIPLDGYARTSITATISRRVGDMNYRVDDGLMRSIALDALSFAVYSHLDFDVPETAEEMTPALKNSPFEHWWRVECAVQVLFDISPPGIRETFHKLSNWGSNRDGRTTVNYRISKGKNISIPLEPLAKIITGFSCIDNIDECRDLLVPEDCIRPGGGLRQMNLLRSRRNPTKDWLGIYKFGNAWNESTLLRFFGRVLIGSHFRWDDEQITFRRTSLISDSGWSCFLPTVGGIDPSTVSFYEICLKKGVPVRNEERKHRIIDAHTSVEMANLTPDYYNTDGIPLRSPLSPPMDMSQSLICDLSHAKLSRVLVGVRNDSFVISQCFQSRWGQAIAGFRTMHRIALNPKLEMTTPCDHPDGPSTFPHSEHPFVFVREGYHSLRPGLPPLEKPCVVVVPVSGSIAARWLSICQAEVKLSSYSGVIGLRHENTCGVCALKFAGDLIQQGKPPYYSPFIF
jgi:hypothetical protein